MNGLPEVTVAGTATADPEIKYLETGDAVVNLTLASNSRRYDRDRGEWVDGATTFLRASAWRHLAEHIAESISRGDRVLATGLLRQRSWETEQGDKRSVLELAITEIGPSLRFATAKPVKAKRTAPATTGDEPPF
ncbi:single-stranded DNA-binding protein [Saccharopolyspora sp. CA-218241]|uniref:single-stranded DNA-binding protein n=1 Tax=Saccharopolyspora sp. CA-218241 TaxID=3240027 RepID=UPI003D968319